MGKKTKLVRVIWVDSAIKTGGWQRLEEVKDFAEKKFGTRCDTVGLLVFDGDQNIAVASSYAYTKEVYGVIKIPKCAVVKMKISGKLQIDL